MTLKQLLFLTSLVRHRETKFATFKNQPRTQTILNLFILGCLIICSYFIYIQYEPNYDSKEYGCNKFFYLFAFWSVTVLYIILGVCCLTLIIASIIFLILGRFKHFNINQNNSEDQEHEQQQHQPRCMIENP